jgi:Resolvase, N terminal domain
MYWWDGVSTEQQDLTAQRDGLHALGVGDDRIYVDHGLTGANRDRPGFGWPWLCRAGDTLVCHQAGPARPVAARRPGHPTLVYPNRRHPPLAT